MKKIIKLGKLKITIEEVKKKPKKRINKEAPLNYKFICMDCKI